ncbi:hypothetical protein AZE42_08163 [Rhizopogon vesiculosus]|uniref:Serpentine receptor class gamma n=1 Tax=Rhizopogon vesiculosus TaxID=180088 RepID=A0A1J8QJT2_9AGAM|nr:hypothetical protein AZE42_08163 [Rhizopogon vesiculosus]
MAISVTEATILAIILECILYGISTFLFGITLWSLTYQRNFTGGFRPMLAVACLLFILSTMHVIVDANHVWQGFISSQDVDQFFEDVSKNAFKNALNELATLFGDAILVSSVICSLLNQDSTASGLYQIYRCYIVWKRIEVVIIPIIGWVAVAVTATYTGWSISQLPTTNADTVFLEDTGKWVISFYSVELVTNVLSTSYDPSSYCQLSSSLTLLYLGILALKLWLVHRRSSGILVTRSRVYPILIIILECGALYSMSLVAILATYLSASNSAYVLTDMIAQIIPITFFLIIVRMAMLRFSDRTGQSLLARTGVANRLPIAKHMTVHIDRMYIR